MLQKFLEVGQVVGTHGIAGEMRVQPWCDSPDFLTKFKTLYLDKNGENSVKVQSVRVHKNIALLKLPDVTSIEQAEKMRGKVLFIKREDAKLSKDNWFVQELLDCEVFDADSGEKLGVLKNNGREYLVPSIKDVVVSVDVEVGKIEIRPIKGIFDDEI